MNVSEFVRRAAAGTVDENSELDELLKRIKAAAKDSIAISPTRWRVRNRWSPALKDAAAQLR